ncbi:unnamed protein product [Cunninghamella echinulata]
MSWQQFIEQPLLSSGKLDQAAIYNSEKNEILASSPGFSLINNEYIDLVNGFTDPAPLSSNGFYINGVKYFTIYSDNQSIRGKSSQGGVATAKCKIAIIIGTYGNNVSPGEADLTIERFCDYLTDNLYEDFTRANQCIVISKGTKIDRK